MNKRIEEHKIFGYTLFVDNGTLELGIPLEYGIRISHLSYLGEENLFYAQPNDMTDLTTPDGWRVRGGHRLWVAPESENNVYFPDNNPIKYELSDNSVTLFQDTDPWLNIKKSIKLTFIDDECIELEHEIVNTGDTAKKCAVWPVTSVAPCGVEHIPLPYRDFGADPLHCITLWDYTSLGDKRAAYTRELITLRHEQIEEKYKIGVGHPLGSVKYINKGVIFEKVLDVNRNLTYPDGNVSFETFMCKHMVEIETLSPLSELVPGDSYKFKEIWKLKKEK